MQPLIKSFSPTAVARAWGGPLGSARVAQAPEDFVVNESLGFAADGEGPHLLVQIQKKGLTTLDACRLLGNAWGVPSRTMGYAGRKDRWAVTTQWLTVPWPVTASLPDAPLEVADGLQVLRVNRHRRKLKVGSLRGNHFSLRLQGLDTSPRELNHRLTQIALYGVPNYFGPQRFGRRGRNLTDAVTWLSADPKSAPPSSRGMLISALRAACFNRVLSARVEAGTWATALPFDLLGLDGRDSLFSAESETAARLALRLAAQRIHPTGPLPGRKATKLGVADALAAWEREILAPVAAWVDGLSERGVDAARRPLRVAVDGLSWHQPSPETLELQCYLRRGSYATAVLAELVEWSAP